MSSLSQPPTPEPSIIEKEDYIKGGDKNLEKEDVSEQSIKFQQPNLQVETSTTDVNSYRALTDFETPEVASTNLNFKDPLSINTLQPTQEPKSPIESVTSINPVYEIVPVATVSAQDFVTIVEEVRIAIAKNTFPKRIYQGSSGSYFCYQLDGGGGFPEGRQGIGKSPSLCAVFKPKNEEPYGNLNPKWTKWLHKNLLPCCFGRSSLIPNVGYLSEVSASLVDRHLELGLVPRTEVVKLASPTFHYSKRDRRAYLSEKKPLPLKLGSFQLFLKGYFNASNFLTEHPWPQNCSLSGDITTADSYIINNNDLETQPMINAQNPSIDEVIADDFWTERRQMMFRLEIEKLVIFDYLIRNTDRGLDNWMIKPTSDGIQVRAIDHGLAFPHKHPDNWRSYPYGWLYLPLSLLDRPFSKTTRHYFLAKLTSAKWWNSVESALTQLNHLDPDFNAAMFNGQLEVMRGQAYNIILSLKNSTDGPIQLCRRKQVIVLEIDEDNSIPMDDLNEVNIQGGDPENKDWPDPFFQQQVSTDTSTRKKVIRRLKTLSRQPCFSFC